MSQRQDAKDREQEDAVREESSRSADRASASESSRPYAHGGLTEAERDARTETAKAVDLSRSPGTDILVAALQAAIIAAIQALRAQTTNMHDLQARHEKGYPVNSQHIGTVKVKIDEVVQNLVAAVADQGIN